MTSGDSQDSDRQFPFGGSEQEPSRTSLTQENSSDSIERKERFEHCAAEEGGETAADTVGEGLGSEGFDLKGQNGDFEVEDSSEREKIQQELTEFRDKYYRVLAEFDNFRKKFTQQRAELLKYQGQSLIVDLLEVLDNFTRALAVKSGDVDTMRVGVEMIHRQFLEVFNRWEVRGEPSEGQPFDPVKHNAISTVPTEDFPPGTVVTVIKEPFFYKDRLIRPGEVIVAAEPRSSSVGEAQKGATESDTDGTGSSFGGS